MFWNHHGMLGGQWLMMFIFIILAVVAVYLIMDTKNNRGDRDSGRGYPRERNGEERALEILNERFAKGEIDEEEYQSKKRALQNR